VTALGIVEAQVCPGFRGVGSVESRRGVGCSIEPLVLHGRAHPEGRVAALAVVEDLEVLKIAFASSRRVRQRRRLSSSTCAQNASATALSGSSDPSVASDIASSG
jgi:hypothetical protein